MSDEEDKKSFQDVLLDLKKARDFPTIISLLVQNWEGKKDFKVELKDLNKVKDFKKSYKPSYYCYEIRDKEKDQTLAYLAKNKNIKSKEIGIVCEDEGIRGIFYSIFSELNFDFCYFENLEQLKQGINFLE